MKTCTFGRSGLKAHFLLILLTHISDSQILLSVADNGRGLSLILKQDRRINGYGIIAGTHR